MPPEQFLLEEKYVLLHGIQIFTHSVGDMGVRCVLDAYQHAQERNGRRDSRHRIEHIELVHPDDLPAQRAAFQRCLDTGGAYDAEFRVRVQSGEYRWFRSRGICEKDANGKPYGNWIGPINQASLEERIELLLAQ